MARSNKHYTVKPVLKLIGSEWYRLFPSGDGSVTIGAFDSSWRTDRTEWVRVTEDWRSMTCNRSRPNRYWAAAHGPVPTTVEPSTDGDIHFILRTCDVSIVAIEDDLAEFLECGGTVIQNSTNLQDPDTNIMFLVEVLIEKGELAPKHLWCTSGRPFIHADRVMDSYRSQIVTDCETFMINITHAGLPIPTPDMAKTILDSISKYSETL